MLDLIIIIACVSANVFLAYLFIRFPHLILSAINIFLIIFSLGISGILFGLLLPFIILIGFFDIGLISKKGTAIGCLINKLKNI